MLTVEEVAAIPLFAALPTAELERLARTSADLQLAAGEFAVHEGGEGALFVVLSGKIEVVKNFDGVARSLGWRIPGAIFGEVPISLGSPFPGGYRAVEPSRVMRIEIQQYYAVASVAKEVAQKVNALARERLGGLQAIATEPHKSRVTLVGHRWNTACADLRRFLSRNQISFDWVAADTPEAAAIVEASRLAPDGALARMADGAIIENPEVRDLANRLGLQTSPRADQYDVAIVGGGPAGLAAAVYGASEGLRTIVVEREAPGGQAGTSSRIENYLGFPSGISGDELSSRALQQARRLGAEILVTRSAVGVDPDLHLVSLDGGAIINARSLILATGVTWRRLAIEGMDRLIGKGIFYGASRSEANSIHGQDVHLVGAGNSAGQAALHFAGHARRVTLVVRGERLADSMSHYLIEQLRAKSNIAVQLQSEIHAVHGDASLAAVEIRDRAGGTVTRHDCGGLFIFIGADAETEWLPKQIVCNERGYVLTGDDVRKAGRWSQGRDPYLLETSAPGVFACGDVRLSPVKRVASAVGEGSMAIAFVHQYLAREKV
ncbi:MAG: FAD-dependent oxidoreductase [Hyphomicrobiales bacterium]|nr:FAD-dependent oxidoreductase [Hyphomicrobiales bacterium]